ncbi:unnamed protein product [Boreogadus saida]
MELSVSVFTVPIAWGKKPCIGLCVTEEALARPQQETFKRWAPKSPRAHLGATKGHIRALLTCWRAREHPVPIPHNHEQWLPEPSQELSWMDDAAADGASVDDTAAQLVVLTTTPTSPSGHPR